MRGRLFLALLLVFLLWGHAGIARADPQTDAIARLLGSLQTALLSGQPQAVAALTVLKQLPVDAALTVSSRGGPPTEVVIRERLRHPTANGIGVIADVFVARGRSGRLATWDIELQTGEDTADHVEILTLKEIGGVGDLTKQELDADTQFRVHDLQLKAPDFTLTMASGTAFVTRAPSGISALVLRGGGRVVFTPPSQTEQGQLRLFNGRPSLTVAFNEAFVRVNPYEFERQITSGMLVPQRTSPDALRRATTVFLDRAPLSLGVGLADLSVDSWALNPSPGTVIVEFRTSRFGWLTYMRTPLEDEDVSLLDRERQRYLALYASAEHADRRGRTSTDADEFTIDHYDVDVRIDPRGAWVSGRGTLLVRRPPSNRPLLSLKLAEPLVIAAVSSPGVGRLLAMRVTGSDQVVIYIPDEITAEPFRLDVQYAGPLFAQTANREALLPDAQTETSNGLLLTPTERFLYSTQTAWYPRATGYATANIRISLPFEYDVVASGTFVDTTTLPVVSGRGPALWRAHTFRADRPVRYLACVISRWESVDKVSIAVPAVAAIGGRVTPSQAEGPSTVTARIVATPRQVNGSRSLARRVSRILSFYASTVGEAPYPDLTLAAADDRQPGGHAPAYFAIIQEPLPAARVSWAEDPVAFNNYPDFVVAHELAHQWWGQAVGWKTYHDQWLSEGLAQYFAVLYLEFDRGPGAAADLLEQMRRSVIGLSSEGPIALGYRLGQVRRNTRPFRAVLYNKTAVVLDMLRRMMGDESFFAGVRQFYRDYRFQRADTDGFRRTLQALTPLPLDRFFERWIEGASLPDIRIKWHAAAEGREAIITVEQGIETFDLPLELTIEYSDGRIEQVLLFLHEDSSEHRVPLSGHVRRIRPRLDRALAKIAS